MTSTTPNFGWNLPAIAGDNDTWGTELNINISDQDTVIDGIATTNAGTVAPTVPQTASVLSAGVPYINTNSAPWNYSIWDGTAWCKIGSIDPSGHTFIPVLDSGNFIGDVKYSCQTANHGGSLGTLWVLCNGQQLSTTTYSSLFDLIGYTYTYTSPPPSNMFSVPDMRGAVVGGINKSGLVPTLQNPVWPAMPTTWAAGQYYGEEKHVLTEAELAAHQHNLVEVATGVHLSQSVGVSIGAGNGIPYANSSIPTTNAFTTTLTGSNTAHNTIQPTVFAGSYFIYTGV